jgi:hypothetical protein
MSKSDLLEKAKVKYRGGRSGVAEVRRLDAPPPLSRLTGDVHRQYDAYAQMARHQGIAQPDRIAEVKYQRDRMELEAAYRMQSADRSGEQRDAMTLPESNVGYATQITRARSSWTSRYNSHLHAFGLNNRGIDPRASKARRIEINVAGEASRYCCGAAPNTASLDIKVFQTGRGWYSIGFRDCWSSRWERSYGEIFDWEAEMKIACEEIMHRVHAEVTWWGDGLQGLRGAKDLPWDRVYLPTPFDQLEYTAAYDTYAFLANYSELKYGETSYQKDHILLPTGWGLVTSKKNFDSSCCETLGEDFTQLDGSMKKMRTDYMNSLGDKNTAAMLFYRRDPNVIIADHSVGITWLPPSYDNGEILHQCVMRLGEMSITDQSAGLLVSNALTSRC